MQATLKKAILQIKLMILNFDSTLFYNLSRNSGKTLLIGGWVIFSIWLVGRYLFVYDLEFLAFIGFLWVYFGLIDIIDNLLNSKFQQFTFFDCINFINHTF